MDTYPMAYDLPYESDDFIDSITMSALMTDERRNESMRKRHDIAANVNFFLFLDINE